MLYAQNKTYMTAEDETEETLALVAMLEGIPITRLYENIDLHRSAGCGFAKAAKIFATQYLRSFMDSQNAATKPEPYSTALTLQQAMLAVANDSDTDSISS